MANAVVQVPCPGNEPVRGYEPGSEDKKALKAAIKELSGQKLDIPLIIGGEEVRTGNKGKCVCPHDHKHVLATYHKAGAAEVRQAIKAAQKAKAEWAAMPWEHRASILLKAAELLAGPWRMKINAATILGQSKTPFQAEIDSACELIDFWRFNPFYYQQILSDQPPHSPAGVWNYVEQRPLDGFVFAVTPFNFTSIAGQSSRPHRRLMGQRRSIWKPVRPFSLLQQLLHGMKPARWKPDSPPGVINFVPADRRPDDGNTALRLERSFGGVHFTGSTKVFQFDLAVDRQQHGAVLR